MGTPLAGQFLRAVDLQSLLPEYTDYTPVNTGVTVGNGSMTARYMVNGQMCWVVWLLTAGTTTAITANILMGLPFASVGEVQLNGEYRRFGVGSSILSAAGGSGVSQVSLRFNGTGNNGLVNASNPHAIAASDSIKIAGIYPIALA